MNPTNSQPVTTWSSGPAYEAYVGRWSRLVAREFLAWLAVPHGGRWLDAGCGTGALAEAVVQRAAPQLVIGIDRSLGFIPHARQRLHGTEVRFAVGDLQALPLANGVVDAAVSGLVLNFVGDQLRAAVEMARVVRPGGLVAVYVWDYAGGMQFIRRFWDAALALDPAAAAYDQGERFPICQPGPLAALLASAGLRAVEVRAVEIATTFRNFDDYWSPFLGGQGPAPSYLTSRGEAERAALRERLRGELPAAADGSIPLTARAWAARGNV